MARDFFDFDGDGQLTWDDVEELLSHTASLADDARDGLHELHGRARDVANGDGCLWLVLPIIGTLATVATLLAKAVLS